MKKFEGYLAGVNFSGYDYSIFNESDFAQVASWGCDHIRLPFMSSSYADYTKEDPVIGEGLEALDRIVYFCKKAGLNVVLDMHGAPGFYYSHSDNTLFESRDRQLEYIDAWRILAKRYKNEGANISFDLLNETLADRGSAAGTAKWNSLWREVTAAIHEEAPNRTVIVGANWYNCIDQMEFLDIVEDERVQYNFHCYFPMMFTHQRIDNPKYLAQVPWPFDSMEHAEFFGGPDKIWEDHKGVVCIDHLWKEFEPVERFTEKYDRPLYCGEYGVCSYADLDSKIRWLKDIGTVFRKYGIGHCVWEYLGFTGLVDPKTRKPRSEELIRVIASE